MSLVIPLQKSRCRMRAATYPTALRCSYASVNFRTASVSSRRSSRARSRQTPRGLQRQHSSLRNPRTVAARRRLQRISTMTLSHDRIGVRNLLSTADTHPSFQRRSRPWACIARTATLFPTRRKAHPALLRQARNDAVELKLRVLDDKLLRAQISEEDKLKVHRAANCRTCLYRCI